jgi:hypothetical protein
MCLLLVVLLQTVRLQLPSRNSSLLCCIDATLEGNIARFINHRWEQQQQRMDTQVVLHKLK